MNDIYIHGLSIKNNKITNHIEVFKDLQQYVKTSEMFVEYDTKIYANESILNIPLIASVLPLAWLSGSNIIVNTLDKGFKESMDTLQTVFASMLPLAPFKTEIKVDELVENEIKPQDPERSTGLLFSGGVDSTFSMIKHNEKKPRLIMHWGVEGPPYPVYKEYYEMVESAYSDYAKKNDLTFNLIKTNVLEILDQRKIEHTFHKELYYGSLWVRLQHSLVLLSLTAPLSINRFDRLLIAASNWKGSRATVGLDRPHSQRPETDEVIGWADLTVKHDGYIERNKKIRVISEHLKNNQLTLRTCIARPGDQTTPEKMNCNNCSKCYRTIMQLVLFESDPEKCGYNVDDSTFSKLRDYYEEHGLDSYGLITRSILPEDIGFDYRGAEEFFKWLKGFTLSDNDLAKDRWVYRDFYDNIPYPFAKVVNEVYKILNINIHHANPKLPQKIVNRLHAIEAKKGRMTGL